MPTTSDQDAKVEPRAAMSKTPEKRSKTSEKRSKTPEKRRAEEEEDEEEELVRNHYQSATSYITSLPIPPLLVCQYLHYQSAHSSISSLPIAPLPVSGPLIKACQAQMGLACFDS